jgi:hypothetical protein
MPPFPGFHAQIGAGIPKDAARRRIFIHTPNSPCFFLLAIQTADAWISLARALEGAGETVVRPAEWRYSR